MYSGHLFAMGGGVMWLLWIFLAVLLVYLFNDIFSKSNKVETNHPDVPLQTLDERYARGEIELNEYQKIKKNLQS